MRPNPTRYEDLPVGIWAKPLWQQPALVKEATYDFSHPVHLPCGVVGTQYASVNTLFLLK